MSACDEWREQVMDHALGQSASAELRAHLSTCSACAEALGAWRARAGLLDATIRQAVAAEPGAGLAQRILARIDSRHAPPGRSWRWRVAAAGLATAAAVALVAFEQSVSRKRDQERILAAAAALSKWRAPTDGLLRSRSEDLTGNVPRLGATFFEMKSMEDSSSQEKQDR